jgi:hypothetical protein
VDVTIRTVVENLKLSAEAIQQKTGANLEFLQHLELTGNELRQVSTFMAYQFAGMTSHFCNVYTCG